VITPPLNTSIVILDHVVSNSEKLTRALIPLSKSVEVLNQENLLYDKIATGGVDAVLMNLDFKPNDAVTVLGELKVRYPEFKGFIVIYAEVQDEYVQELVYNSGADAFISFINKPLLLQLFLKNLLRRKEFVVKASDNLLDVDNDQYLIAYKGQSFQLPRKEFLIVDLLYRHKGRYFSKVEIAEQIWGDRLIAAKRRIDVHIYNIRQVLGDEVISCRRGKGYMINS